MLSLPHGRILLLIGWVLVGFVIYGSLASQGPPLGVPVSDKAQHFAGYFLVMVWFSGLYPRHQHWLLALGFFFLGGLLELAQGAFTQHRQMDLWDLAANTAGISAGYILAGFGLANWARRVEAWLTSK